MYLLKNVRYPVYHEDGRAEFAVGDIHVSNAGYFTEFGENITPLEDEEIINCTGKIITPFPIDIHTHGCMGKDFSAKNLTLEDIQMMAEWYGSKGIAAILPTIITGSKESMEYAAHVIAEYILINSGVDIALPTGVRIEGPFLNRDKKGAHNPDYLVNPDFGFFREILDSFVENVFKPFMENTSKVKDLTIMIDLDPTLPDSIPFMSDVKNYIAHKCSNSVNLIFSIAHSTANYKQANDAFYNGFSHITHLYNAMEIPTHREDYIPGAFFDDEEGVNAELICDGVHIKQSVIRKVFKLKPYNTILVSDSMCGTGLPDGKYELGGLPVTVEDGKATNTGTDTIAGGTSNVVDCMVKAIEYGVDPLHAIWAATALPAKILNLKMHGRIELSYCANFIIFDREYNIEAKYRNGRKLVKKPIE